MKNKSKKILRKKRVIAICTKHMTKDIEIFLGKILKKKGFHVIFFIPRLNNIDKEMYQKEFFSSFNKIYYEPNEKEALKLEINSSRVLSEITELEKKYNISMYRLYFVHRIVGSGYWASGGIKQQRHKIREKSNHIDVMKIALTYTKFWENIFNTNNVFLAINLPNHAHIIAKKKGIISERVQGARFGNTQFWSQDLYLQPEDLGETFDTLKGNFAPIKISSPYPSHITFRKKHINAFRLFDTFKKSFYSLAQVLITKLRGFEKAKNQYLIDEFLISWRIRREFLKLKKMVSFNLKNSNKINYVFFPLQTEPEIAVHGIAQDFFFQLSAINLISRDLPADYFLVVKEHLYAIGRRPADFYKQIKSLKNVLIADPTEYGLEYVKRASAVASITGTSAWEAAAMGLPVITFSKNNAFNFLNHVFYIKEPDSTKNIIPKILNKSWPTKKSLKDGSKFYHAYFKSSFNIGENHEFISWKSSKNKENILRKSALLLLKKLFEKHNIDT